MDDADRPAFTAAFHRLAKTFRMKLKPGDVDEIAGTYFRTLEPYPLVDVIAAGATCLRTYRRFPKVADWLAAMVQQQTGAPADVRVMSTQEATEYVRAERLHFEDDAVCACLLCQAVGIVRPRRFVPDIADDGRTESAFCPAKNRIVVVGHWAHGQELADWYAARDRFFGAATRAGVNTTMLRRYGFIYTPPPTAPREPGMEG